jgi:Na+/H+ antiporter NhaD/arsenite permease-like protein
MYIALAIFLLTYIFIAVQRFPKIPLDRPAASTVGAVLMILFGILSFEEAVRAVDYNTIILLLGMMIIVAYLSMAGFLDFIAVRILQAAKNPLQLLILIVFSSGLLSALFVNDTICLIYTPILIRVIKLAKLKPQPYLIALGTASNIGSVVTIVGNPQNMLIGMQSKISFLSFFLHLLPIGIVGLLIDIAVISLIYKEQLFTQRIEVQLPEPKLDKKLFNRAILVLFIVLAGFLLGEEYISIPVVAATGAALIFILGGKPPARAFRRVDWTLLLFFANLFIVMHGVEKSGLTSEMLALFSPLFQLSGFAFIFGLSIFSIIVSNLVSNVPFVMMMLPFADKLAKGNVFWYTLAMSSTFAGNLTIIGSVANLIVVEISRRTGIWIGFWEYAKVGVVVTILTIIMGSTLLALY